MAMDRYSISPISHDQRCEMYYIFLLCMDSDGKGFKHSNCIDTAGHKSGGEAAYLGGDIMISSNTTVLSLQRWKWLGPMHYLYSRHEDTTLKGLGWKSDNHLELDSRPYITTRVWNFLCNILSTTPGYDDSKLEPHPLLGILVIILRHA